MSIQEAVIPWTLGELLAKARKTAGLSVPEMATDLGVDVKTIGNYEHDRTKPNRATRMHYANRAGWPIEWLEPTREVTAGLPGDASKWNRRRRRTDTRTGPPNRTLRSTRPDARAA